MRLSLNTLIREGSGTSASWWLDALGVLGGVAAGWLLLNGRLVGGWEQRLGAFTVVAIGICVGSVLPMLWRVLAARKLGGLLAARSSDLVGNESQDFSSRFFAGVLRASDLSSDRCSTEDFRRAAEHASAEFARFATRTAIPASVIAFVVPVIALVGGWNVSRQTGPSINALQSMAPSMIAGIGCAAVVVLLIELYIAAMRNAPARWASSIITAGIPHRADQDVFIQTTSGGSGSEGHAGATTSDAPAAVGMPLDEFRKLFDGPGRSNKA
jgi:hypothetical protein